MKINIEVIEYIQKVRCLINSISLDKIEFYKDGKKLEFDSKIIDDFKFTGLNNIDFILTGYYKDNNEEIKK